jgi:hypothetical protein
MELKIIGQPWRFDVDKSERASYALKMLKQLKPAPLESMLAHYRQIQKTGLTYGQSDFRDLHERQGKSPQPLSIAPLWHRSDPDY